MTGYGTSQLERPAESSQATDMVTLHLLLPARQLSALTVAAARVSVSVEVLLHGVITDFLQSHVGTGFVGEVAGQPSAPRPLFEGWQ